MTPTDQPAEARSEGESPAQGALGAREQTPKGATPAVSVVLIVFNDADRLPNAARSALEQTFGDIELIICDDGSTDGTREVAEALCTADTRVRYVRLPENSGGCSAPRNAGLAASTAQWVCFLDSDDELPRTAVEYLLGEAERTGADVVAGRVSRFHVYDRRWSGWNLRLFERPNILHGIREQPERLFDTLAVGKLYKREFLIRTGQTFLPGILFEDCLWTIQVYALAGLLAVIPDTVYVWKVHYSDSRPSITNSRGTKGNVEARIKTNRIIDEWLLSSGNSDLLAAKQAKFVRHDLSLYLGDMLVTDDEWNRFLLQRFAAYVEGLPGLEVEALPLLHQTALRAMRSGDVEATRTVARAIDRGEYAMEVIRDGALTLWSPPQQGPMMSRMDEKGVDITALGLHKQAFGDVRLAHDVLSIRPAGGVLLMEVRTWNTLGVLDTFQNTQLWLEVARRGGRDLPASVAGQTSERGRVWHTSFWLDPAEFPWALASREQAFDLSFVARAEGVAAESRSVASYPRPDGPGGHQAALSQSMGPRTNPFVGLLPVATPEYRLALCALPSPAAMRGVRHDAERGLGLTVLQGADRIGSRLVDSVKKRVRRRVGPPLAVFSSELGLGYSGNPRYIFEELMRSGWLGEAVWVRRDRSNQSIDFPDRVELVAEGSREYYVALGSAKYWITDRIAHAHVRKPHGTTYVQTWHGFPVSRAFFNPSRHDLEASSQALSWDYLVVPHYRVGQTLKRTFRTNAVALSPGSPRVDPLVSHRGRDRSAADSVAFGLPDSNGLNVLYAPAGWGNAAQSRTRLSHPST